MNKNNMPLVSIIIPNFNKEIFLTQCLESCVLQAYKNLEIVIVDDCSNDNSINIIENYKDKYENIKFIRNKTNRGVAASRDIGIKSCHGEWITTLDSDDVLISRDKIKKEVDKLKEYSFGNDVIIYSGVVILNKEGKQKKRVMQKKNTKEGDLFVDILTRNCAIPRDFIFPKNLYFEVGGYDAKIPIYEDWDLKIRLAKRAKFYFSRIDGIGYRRHGYGLSSAKNSEHNKWINYVFNKNSNNLKNKKELSEKLMRNINQNMMTIIKNKINNLLTR